MARKAGTFGKALESILGERKRLAQTERKVVGALNRALGKIGYKVVAKGAAERPVRRRRRRKVQRRRRTRGKK